VGDVAVFLRGEFGFSAVYGHVALVVAVNEEFVDATIEAIVKGAKTGKIGDGKIMVLPLERCVRIRTGEEGKDAIG